MENEKKSKYQRYSGGIREGVLEEILESNRKMVTLTEEIVKLQHENDKLQRKTVNLSVIAVAVAIIIPTILEVLRIVIR